MLREGLEAPVFAWQIGQTSAGVEYDESAHTWGMEVTWGKSVTGPEAPPELLKSPLPLN